MVRVTCPIRSILISSPLPVLGVTGTNRHWYARRCGVPLIKVKNESGRGDSLSVSSEGTIRKLHGREKASGGPPSCVTHCHAIRSASGR